MSNLKELLVGEKFNSDLSFIDELNQKEGQYIPLLSIKKIIQK